jgi:hypothetical protein
MKNKKQGATECSQPGHYTENECQLKSGVKAQRQKTTPGCIYSATNNLLQLFCNEM